MVAKKVGFEGLTPRFQWLSGFGYYERMWFVFEVTKSVPIESHREKILTRGYVTHLNDAAIYTVKYIQDGRKFSIGNFR